MLNQREAIAPSVVCVTSSTRDADPPALDAEHRYAVSPAAIRGRIAKVVAAYREPSAAFPDPIPADEAAAVLALTDDEINDLQAVLVFARRWGVCLNWLLLGDERSLISVVRESRQREVVGEDPVVPAFHEWQQRWREYDITNKIYIEMIPRSPGEPEAKAANDAAMEAEMRACERVALTQATSLEGVRMQLLAHAGARWSVCFDGHSDRVTDYVPGGSECRAEIIELRAFLSIYAAIARMLGRDDATDAEAAVSQVVLLDANEGGEA